VRYLVGDGRLGVGLGVGEGEGWGVFTAFVDSLDSGCLGSCRMYGTFRWY
jgi:hypothetical protein